MAVFDRARPFCTRLVVHDSLVRHDLGDPRTSRHADYRPWARRLLPGADLGEFAARSHAYAAVPDSTHVGPRQVPRSPASGRVLIGWHRRSGVRPPALTGLDRRDGVTRLRPVRLSG